MGTPLSLKYIVVLGCNYLALLGLEALQSRGCMVMGLLNVKG